MRNLSQQLAPLPSALLLLLIVATLWSTATADSVAVDLAALPTSPAERNILHRRHEQIWQRLAHQAPVGVRKMSEDPSEKFFPEYWRFDGDEQHSPDIQWLSGPDGARDGSIQDTNFSSVSTTHEFLPPILPHKLDSSEPFTYLSNSPRHLFDKRGFQCPIGYHDCASVGFKNSCCATNEACRIIRDTGVGVVGCCPSGSRCSGSVSTCDVAHGFKSCPHSRNKNGCCAPGFRCAPIGCIKIVATATIRTTRVVVTVQTTLVRPTHPRTVFTTTTFPTRTKTIGPTVQSITRATSPTGATSIVPNESTVTLGLCPTGFYRCSAFFLGGCCRVGRNCHSTHCPARASTEVTENGVVTVLIETGLGVTTINEGTFTVVSQTDPVTAAGATSVPALGDHGPCAVGWSRCAAGGGGGCCPDGYRCGASCTATQAGLPGKVPKAPTLNQASAMERWGSWAALISAAVGFGMIWL